ncbi:type IV secretory system conjugative DNA transfer family protein [Bacillus subtilis]|uniref:type IV secretory system conjugative DNA transfer family protein n=1 Tax=Bacillus subtilis TaxID=1423 RepID=UPI002DBD9C47|nr:type IV secretory system conjugative DNA transfer family protein [Bacillus subtilis]MEC3664947.1 type IV secretory system conjugative DNA transfer family protein [Bacillus subtilis]
MRLNAVMKNSDFSTDKIMGTLSLLEKKSLSSRPSLVFNDPGDELHKKAAVQLKNLGYEVYQFKDTDTASSMMYNPLDYIVELQKNGMNEKANETLEDITHFLFEDEEGTFEDLARSVFKNKLVSLIERSTEKAGRMVSLNSIVIDESDVLNQPVRLREVNETILMNIKAKLHAHELRNLSKTNLNMSDIGFSEKPVAIFLGDSDNSLFNYSKSIFVEHLYLCLVKKTNSKKPQCDRQVYITLRDFEKMNPIRNIDIMVSLSVSARIYFNLLFDSELELLKRYGETTTSRILGNCKRSIGAEYAYLVG